MNRIEFMDRLSRLLADLPEGERGEALQYYNDYLDDAGVENEQEVLEALGTPEQLAASIREGLNEDSAAQGEFSEKGFRQSQEDGDDQLAVRAHRANTSRDFYRRYRGGSAAGSYGAHTDNYQRLNTDGQRMNGQGAQMDGSYEGRGKKRKTGMSTGALILVIICCICAAPILLPVAFAMLVVLLVLAAVAVVVALVLLFSGIICVAAGLWALFAAIVKLFVVPAGALLAIGISLMVIGIGVLLILGMGWILGKFFPTAFRGCVNFCSGLFNRKGGKKA